MAFLDHVFNNLKVTGKYFYTHQRILVNYCFLPFLEYVQLLLS